MEGYLLIQEHETLHVPNVVFVRKQIRESESATIVTKLTQYAQHYGAMQTGPLISAMLGTDPATQKIDTAFYLPINGEIPSTQDVIFKPHLYLINCLKLVYKGGVQGLPVAAEQMNRMIAEHALQPISSVFVVYHNDITQQTRPDQLEMDLYISISPNLM